MKQNANKQNEKSLNELAFEIHRNAVERGFYEKPVECGTQLMLVVSELSEALEADRRGRHVIVGTVPETVLSEDWWFAKAVKDTFEDEITDAIIRLLDLCAAYRIDIEKHIELKMRYNAMRQHKHGKLY